MALRSTGGSEHDAADLSQEIYIKVWRALPSFRGESSFTTWLYRIAQNAATDHARKAARNRTVSLTLENDENEEESGKEMEIAGSDRDPEEAALESEKSTFMEKALNMLSPEHKAVITLRYIEGYSCNEISEILAIDQGTVKSRLFRAREKLKILLEKGNYFT